MTIRRIISPSLSPNTEIDDVRAAIKAMLMLWKGKKGRAVDEAEQWFRSYFTVESVATFISGRAALYTLFKVFGIGKGDEVLMQAFTCVAVPNSARWAGAVPIYVDIDDTLNIDPGDAERKITKQTRAIIIQHTFGNPAKLEELLTLAKKHNLIVIEDCAHSLGGTYRGEKLGTFGDAAFFSFGRDKVISSVWGGAAIISSKFKVQSTKMKEFQEKLLFPSNYWILQQLLHPILFSFILPSYNVIVGKVILEVAKRLRLISIPVALEEKAGEIPGCALARYPNALANLLLVQLKKLHRYQHTRNEQSEYYRMALKTRPGIQLIPNVQKTSCLRFPVHVQNTKDLLSKAKHHGILLGNWYHNVIDPIGVDYGAIGYIVGSCPRAEEAAAHIINLPTLVSKDEAKRVVSLF